MSGQDMAIGALTGRIGSAPGDLIRNEVLVPQLRFELAALLPGYLQLERVLLLEYRRMGLLGDAEVAVLAGRLDQVTPEAIETAALDSMSDIAFTLERHLSAGLDPVPPAWHVDRSRNDLQASAQLMYGRTRLTEIAELLIGLGRSAHRLAVRTVDMPMPGYTHMQAAQVISPAFHLSALAAQLLHTLRRLEAVYTTAGECPMGAGAMAGQELEWDRLRMARLLGFDTVSVHALRAVAQRDWALEACAEFSLLGVAVSRFVTDLLLWSGAGYGFIDLPDAWAGISSAMPQKKNFPVLERIRARTAHLTAAYVGVATAQRNTPYTNSVEVSKESGAQVPAAFDTLTSVLRLFTGVLDNVEFRPDRMRAAAEAEYLGGFTLANLLTLHGEVPWRAAQVIAGRYITEAVARGLPPTRPDPELLVALLAGQGHHVTDPARLLAEAMGDGLHRKRTSGSTHPDAVREMLAGQLAGFERAEQDWTARRVTVAAAATSVTRSLREITDRAAQVLPC